MRIAIRTDASAQIGTGHIARCHSLADALRLRGAQVTFVCRHISEDAAVRLKAAGHALHRIEGSGEIDELAHAGWLGGAQEVDGARTREVLAGVRQDWLIVDHYALDHRWERAMRDVAQRILVVDDLADRTHDCDFLLDQNLGHDAAIYAHLLPEQAALLLGPNFALLRPEFAARREYSLRRRRMPQLKHLLITMGGVDQHNATGQVFAALAGSALPPDCRITVVMGAQAPWLVEVREQAADLPWATEVRVNVVDMADIMAESDLAIGAAGGTSWERCCLGLPSLVAVLADNQVHIAAALDAAGAAVDLGRVEEAGFQRELRLALEQVAQRPGILAAMTEMAAPLVDGAGAARVADILYLRKT